MQRGTEFLYELTLAACALVEWSRTRNVVGVAMPTLVIYELPAVTIILWRSIMEVTLTQL